MAPGAPWPNHWLFACLLVHSGPGTMMQSRKMWGSFMDRGKTGRSSEVPLFDQVPENGDEGEGLSASISDLDNSLQKVIYGYNDTKKLEGGGTFAKHRGKNM